MTHSLIATAVVLLAMAAALVPTPARLVESIYSSRVFPALQGLLTALSNPIPFALFDVLIVAAVVGVVAIAIRGTRVGRAEGWLLAGRRAASQTAVLAALAYLLFLAAWGLNYRRVPLQDKLRFDAARVSSERAAGLASEAVERVNALHAAAHRQGWGDPRQIDAVLAEAFDRARRGLALGSVRPARPKRTLLDPYFRRAGVAGMTDPYFLETLIASDLLPFERSAVIAHEWSHLAGVADEGAASFVGWLACLRGNAAHQYSGWLSLYGDVANVLPPSSAREVDARLAAGPRADLQAVRDRLLRNVNPTMSAAGWHVYDRYLRANRVEEGAASYAGVVRLILGTEFGPDWTPVRR
jgi:hypothetical protein